MSNLYGLHDRQGAPFVPAGGWVVDTIGLSDNPAPTNYRALRGDINWIVRVNWGYGSTGTIPLPHDDRLFLDRLAHYVHNSPGVHAWIIGNEPNHEQERPNGTYITPARYAEVFVRARTLIKTINGGHRVIPAPCAPYHANPIPWTDYWREMLEIIAASGGCDGIAVHAYTRSSNPADIDSDARMGPPLEGTCAGFLTYQDALAWVPPKLRHLPAYLTEFNELLDHGWDDANTGVVQAAYAHINWWNQHAAGAGDLRFQCLVLYRWPKFDKWHIEGKQGVIDDFRAAVAQGYPSPQIHAQNPPPKVDEKLTTHLPAVNTGANEPTPTLPPRDIDPRAKDRGTTIQSPVVPAGRQFWRVTRLYTPNEAESNQLGPNRHVLANAFVNGKRQEGVRMLVTWGGGGHDERAIIHTKHNPGFAFSADHALTPGDFTLEVADGHLTERVVGITMGMQTPEGWNPGAHTSTLVDWELVTMPATQPAPQPVPQQPKPQPTPPATVPVLAHPVQDPARRVISQRFGENPQGYARFGWDGHTGIDFAVPIGTAICAVDSGVPIEIEIDPDGYGLYVKVRHTWGESLYAHLSQELCDVGKPLQAGETLGLSGNSGNSTGPHLHFAMRIFPYQRGAPYDGFSDPAPYLINVPTQPQPPISQREVVKAIAAAALEFGVDPDLLLSLAWAESSFNPRAVSAAGARGLLQLMPPTWDEYAPRLGASDPFDAQDSARVGAAYLAWLIGYLQGNERKALWAYNFGVGNVTGGVQPPAETIEFASKVIHGRDLLKAVGA